MGYAEHTNFYFYFFFVCLYNKLGTDYTEFTVFSIVITIKQQC